MLHATDLERWIDKDFVLTGEDGTRIGHRADKRTVRAIQAALLSERPLLVRGEPGVGKSQLARAAAHMLDRHLISEVVQPRAEYQDLLWVFDHAGRLGQAQLLSTLGAEARELDESGQPVSMGVTRFISPGPVWWALNWSSAKAFHCRAGYSPQPFLGEGDPLGIVLLVDEIDKADVDLPNGLLEVLGNRSFGVPFVSSKVLAREPHPLVIITTNDTRDLPPAFLRRCVVLDLKLPADENGFKSHLTTIAKAHPGPAELDDEVLAKAVAQIWEDRNGGERQDQRVGQAEFLDLLYAMIRVPGGKEAQLSMLEELHPFICGKHRSKGEHVL